MNLATEYSYLRISIYKKTFPKQWYLKKKTTEKYFFKIKLKLIFKWILAQINTNKQIKQTLKNEISPVTKGNTLQTLSLT